MLCCIETRKCDKTRRFFLCYNARIIDKIQRILVFDQLLFLHLMTQNIACCSNFQDVRSYPANNVLFICLIFKDKSIYTIFIDGTDEAVEETFVTSTDGSPLNYTNWFSYDPNNCCGGQDCITIATSSKLWNDQSCERALPSVCEIPWEMSY